MNVFKLYLIPIIIVVLCYLFWYFFFSIYEMDYNITEGTLENSNKKIKIYSKPLNSMGLKVPFRNIEFEIEIKNGDEIIDYIKRENSYSAEIEFKNMEGNIELLFYSKYSLFPYNYKLKLQ